MERPRELGPQEGRCGAVRERDADGSPIRWCRKWPMKGQRRCELDGAKAPQALAAAERRRAEQAAQKVLVRYGVPTAVDWTTAMQESLDETYGNVLALRDTIQRMRPEALTWGISQVVEVGSSQFPGTDVTQAAGVAPLVALYGQERDRLFRMATDCGKLGLEVRKQQLAERDALLVFDMIKAVLGDLGHDIAAPTVQRVLAHRLESLRGLT